MSGGHFEYKQYEMVDISDTLGNDLVKMVMSDYPESFTSVSSEADKQALMKQVADMKDIIDHAITWLNEYDLAASGDISFDRLLGNKK